MQTVHSIAELRACIRDWRLQGQTIVLVPTMGNLHQGHLELVRQARQRGERVVVSIFVNPLQFGAHEDLDVYPRTPEQDQSALQSEGADLLFMPAEQEIYPQGREGLAYVQVPGIDNILCGASRPGHFRGVCTVVSILFNLVQPDIALFGEKDYQQLTILKRMARELHFPVEVDSVPIVREADGLAMSSRNQYLSPAERRRAPLLYQCLQELAGACRHGADLQETTQALQQKLAAQGFQPEYLSCRLPDTLAVAQGHEACVIALVAARLGTTRLIDNLLICK